MASAYVLHCSIPMGTDFGVADSRPEITLWQKFKGTEEEAESDQDTDKVTVKRIQ